MNRLPILLLLAPAAVGHASPSPSDSLRFERGQAPAAVHVAGKRLAGLNAGEPRTVRMFYFLPNDRPFRPEVVQRTKDEMVRVQGWFGEQMEGHGHGYRTFRLETDDQGDPVVHRVDGQHPDSHYLDGTWSAIGEIEGAFDLSQVIAVVVIDNSNNRINRTVDGMATWSGKKSGIAMVVAEFDWETLAHELAHSFGMGHDFRDDSYILSYGLYRSTLSACSAGLLAVHPYFNPDVGGEWGEAPAIELLSGTTYPAGAESVPIRVRISDADGLQQVRVRVPTRESPRYRARGWEMKTCRRLAGEKEAVVEIDYDGVIPSGSTWSLWDLSDPQVHPIALSVTDTDGNRATIDFDLWQVSRQHLATFELGQGVHGLAFAAGDLVSGSGEGVRFWDIGKGTERAAPLAGGVTAMAVSEDGATLASGTGSGHVQLLDLVGGEVIGTLSVSVAPVRSLAFSPDGAVLAWAEQDGIHLWDVATRTRTATLSVGAVSVAFSPDGATLASGSADGVLRLWNVERPAEVSSFRHGGWPPGVHSVAFSPDGTLLASGGDNWTARLWDVGTNEAVAGLGGHGGPVRAVAFSPDGMLLASGADVAVNLWDLEAGERLATLQGEGRGVTTAAFAPDGRRLAAGTKDGRIGLWDISEWLAPRPRRLVMVSGGGQQGASGEPLADPFVVEVRDQYDDPLPGVEITFAITRGVGLVGGQFTVETTTTDAGGRARTVLTPGPGANMVEASAEGLEAVSVSATGVGDPDGPRPEGDYRTWHLPEGAVARLGKGWIGDLVYSPRADLVAVGTFVGTWLYDAATSREVALLPSREVYDIAFSDDGAILASCGYSGDIVRLWDVAAGKQIAEIDYPAIGVALSPDGRTLATRSEYGFEFWDLETGTQTAAMSEGDTWGVRALAFSPDGRTLAAGLWEGTIQLWDAETAALTATLEGHRNIVTSISFAPDGRTLASASDDRTVRLWDLATRSSAATYEGHVGIVYSVAFSPDGNRVASRARDIKLWDVATGQATTFASPFVGFDPSGFVAFSPDGKTLAAGPSKGVLSLWDVAAGTARTLATGHLLGALALALSPDGTKAAAASHDEAHLWDVAAGTRPFALRGHTSRINSVAFSPDGATLASASTDRTIRLWDTDTGAERLTLEAPDDRWISGVAFSPDGSRIASGHAGGTVKVWDLATKRSTATFEADHTSTIGSLAFSPDGTTVAAGTADGFLGLWSLEAGEALFEEKLPGRIHGVSFAADGTALAVGPAIWEIPAGASAANLAREFPGSITASALSPDGSVFVAGTWPDDVHTVEVRDAATGRVIAATPAHGRKVGLLAFCRDGSTFASASVDGTVLVWDLGRVRPHPRALGKLSGDDQEGPPNAALAESLVVEVRDQYGDPLQDAKVTFAVSGGGVLSVETAATDARGRAAATLTLGLAPGPNTVEVTAAGVEPVVFTALTRAIPTTLTMAGGDGQQGTGGVSLAAALAVALLDQAGGPLAGATVTFAVTAGGGTLSVTRDTTDARGRAATDLTLGRQAGPNSVRAAVAGLPPVTFTALGIAPTSDFDGDGLTGLSDFFLFAEALGGSDPRFDLDGNGSVEVADFFLFAEDFGPQERARLVAMARELIGLPDGPLLRQNAPNPFNSQTVIAWFLPEPGPARLEVFALTGQRVALLHKGPGEAGPHRLRWDGRDEEGRLLGSGVYVCRLVTSGGAQTRKLTLLR